LSNSLCGPRTVE